MVPYPLPPAAIRRQLSLLPALTGPGRLTVEERRAAVALLATLLMEAASRTSPDAADDGE